MYQDIDYVERIIYAGANAYLVKNTDKDTLIDSIKKIHQGRDTIYSEEIQNAIVKNHMDTKIPDIKDKYKTTEVEFTKRERQIIDLIFQGLTNNEIASKLDLSYHTITTHRKNVYIKMGVNSFREFSDSIGFFVHLYTNLKSAIDFLLHG
jgi:DNA-binding NarL/FixJ family response regulator